jgi:hypothetical protein
MSSSSNTNSNTKDDNKSDKDEKTYTITKKSTAAVQPIEDTPMTPTRLDILKSRGADTERAEGIMTDNKRIATTGSPLYNGNSPTPPPSSPPSSGDDNNNTVMTAVLNALHPSSASSSSSSVPVVVKIEPKEEEEKSVIRPSPAKRVRRGDETDDDSSSSSSSEDDGVSIIEHTFGKLKKKEKADDTAHMEAAVDEDGSGDDNNDNGNEKDQKKKDEIDDAVDASPSLPSSSSSSVASSSSSSSSSSSIAKRFQAKFGALPAGFGKLERTSASSRAIKLDLFSFMARHLPLDIEALDRDIARMDKAHQSALTNYYAIDKERSDAFEEMKRLKASSDSEKETEEWQTEYAGFETIYKIALKKRKKADLECSDISKPLTGLTLRRKDLLKELEQFRSYTLKTSLSDEERTSSAYVHLINPCFLNLGQLVSVAVDMMIDDAKSSSGINFSECRERRRVTEYSSMLCQNTRIDIFHKYFKVTSSTKHKIIRATDFLIPEKLSVTEQTQLNKYITKAASERLYSRFMDPEFEKKLLDRLEQHEAGKSEKKRALKVSLPRYTHWLLTLIRRYVKNEFRRGFENLAIGTDAVTLGALEECLRLVFIHYLCFKPKEANPCAMINDLTGALLAAEEKSVHDRTPIEKVDAHMYHLFRYFHIHEGVRPTQFTSMSNLLVSVGRQVAINAQAQEGFDEISSKRNHKMIREKHKELDEKAADDKCKRKLRKAEKAKAEEESKKPQAVECKQSRWFSETHKSRPIPTSSSDLFNTRVYLDLYIRGREFSDETSDKQLHFKDRSNNDNKKYRWFETKNDTPFYLYDDKGVHQYTAVLENGTPRCVIFDCYIDEKTNIVECLFGVRMETIANGGAYVCNDYWFARTKPNSKGKGVKLEPIDFRRMPEQTTAASSAVSTLDSKSEPDVITEAMIISAASASSSSVVTTAPPRVGTFSNAQTTAAVVASLNDHAASVMESTMCPYCHKVMENPGLGCPCQKAKVRLNSINGMVQPLPTPPPVESTKKRKVADDKSSEKEPAAKRLKSSPVAATAAVAATTSVTAPLSPVLVDRWPSPPTVDLTAVDEDL